MNEHEFAELAAGYALRSLSAHDEARYLAALRAHPEWAPIAEEDAETVASLADIAPPEAPSPGARDALLDMISSTPQLPAEPAASAPADEMAVPAPGAVGRTARPKRLRMLFALAACLALVVGIGFGSVALNNHLSRPDSVVALDEIEAAGDADRASVALAGDGRASVHWSADLGRAVLVAEGLEQPEPDHTYQLWFVRGETASPAGLFEPESGEAIAPLDGEFRAGDVIAVTVEQAGGSPTGLPTTEPIFAIPTD